jgi:hypothetical protein
MFVPGGLHGERDCIEALDVCFFSLDLWMSGQTRPNRRCSHITHKRVRPASIEHTHQPTESQIVGVETAMDAFTDYLAACVRINVGDTWTHRG